MDQKRGSDIYQYKKREQISIANLITQLFILNLAKITVFQAITIGYIKFYQSKKSLKVWTNALAIVLWWLLTCQNSHADIVPLILITWLLARQCSQKTFHFLSISPGPTSISSGILVTLRKSHNCGVFISCERCFWDVSHTSRNRHLFWDMFEMS